jgi:hypothetical protein
MFRFFAMDLGLLAFACNDAPTPSAGAVASPFLTEIVLHDGQAPDWSD